MSSNRNTLVILALILLTCLIYSPYCIQANDEQLISKMCGATAMPAVCQSCMDKSCGRQVVQDLDVILCSIRCTYDDTFGLIDNVNDYANHATDATVKKVCLGCVDDYKLIQDNLMKITELFPRRQFDAAKAVIDNQIYPKMKACTDSVKQSGIPYPPPLFGQGVIVSSDYQMTYQLLSVIKA